jgi:hypothetical protein
VRFHSPLRRRPDAATWTIARDVSQQADPDVRPLGRAASAFIAEKMRRLSIPLIDDVPPQHLMCHVHSAGRRRACPVHCQTVRPCCEVHCVHHHLYVAREASPARQYYADHGCQGTRRLHQQRTLVAPSITSVMFLGPHVGAQYPCTCPLSYKRGGMHRYNGGSDTDSLRLSHSQVHTSSQAQYITQWSRVLRSGGPNYSKPLCVLVFFSFPPNMQNA